ncbi:MAG: WD40/YVTN/BNR-like repeat-containing protein [Gemmatimonadales bacterium]
MLLALSALPAAAQQSAAPPPFKGIWEPVSFSEDIDLREVFFVTADKGWAVGGKGTIIHTKDGGATWTAQLGGDPAAAEGRVTLLRFIDETHGWAVKDNRILRTEDGESWEDLGAAPQYIHELAMSSPMEGVAAGYLGMGRNPSTLLKTRDGGKTWKPVAGCAVKAVVGGLNREFGCEVIRIQFVTASVGYLVARYQCAGMGCSPPPILGKTEDAGESWRFFVGPGDADVVGATDLFFTDENTGIVHTTDGKLSRTTDGGVTWKGLLASVYTYGSRLIFADPEVGWALEYKVDGKVSYTVDGGARWNSRAFRFPTAPRAWSFPRRDRAYAVGDHGMVMRYRVVPQAEPVKPGVVLAPAMPAFASPLEAQVPQLESFVQELTTVVAQLPDSAAAAAPATPPAGVDAPLPTPAPGEPSFAQDAPPTPFVNNCCGKPLNRFNVILGAVLQSLPQFVAKFKNTNLLVAGLRMLVTMPSQLGDLRGAFRAFKQATDKAGAQAALAQLGTAATSLQQSTKAAFQKEVAP